MLALATLGCQRPATAPEAPHAPDRGTPAGRVDASPSPTAATEPTHPLELIPARARIMMMGRSPSWLASAWERERLAAAHPLQYEAMVEDMKRETGLDLLDPTQLSALGIDISAPAGFAVLSVQDEAVALFGGLSDARPLVETIERLLGQPVARRTVGTAEVLELDREVDLVLRGSMFAFVLVDRRHPGSPDYALEVARIDPARSLAHASVMHSAWAGLPNDADLRGLLDPAGLVRDELEASQRREQDELARVNQQMDQARRSGASAEELESLREQVQDQQQFMARRRREQQVAQLLLSRTLGSIEGIGLAVDASDRGLLGRIHVALDPRSAFRELLHDTDQPPGALLALGDEPNLVMSGRLDVGTAIELVSQVALAARGSYAEVNDEIRRQLHFDFDRQLRPLLDGHASFAVTAAEPRGTALSTDAFVELFGGVLSIGVTDEAAARALLDGVMGQWSAQRIEPAPEIGGYRIDANDGPLQVWVAVVAGQLVASTDLSTLRRLRDGETGPGGARWADAEAWGHLTRGTAAARLALHHRLPIAAMFGLMGSFDSFDFPNDVDDMLSMEFDGDDIRSIPRGKQVRRLVQQQGRIIDTRRGLRRTRDAERLMAMWTHARALGTTAGTARQVDTGLMLEGGHYVPGGAGAYVEAVMMFDELERDGTTVDAQLEQTRRKLDELETQLLEARRKELQRALGRRR
ncbi:MAG: hypothetical protein AB1Z98_17420 [Nannocystaceae bacterium]